MTRREWLAMMSTAPFARRVAADRAERVAQIVAAFESQGIHRTGTDVDRASAEWLAAEVRDAGLTPSLEPFPLSRVDPIDAAFTVRGRRISGVPLFDAAFTGAAGIEGRFGPLGADAELALAESAPNAAAAGALGDARRTSRYKAIVCITRGGRPGLCPSNADAFLKPFGPPVLQVSSEEGRFLEESARQGAAVHLVARVERKPVEAVNVTARLAGEDGSLPPLVVMTPRSGWWTCASERGGGIACWLELMRELKTGPLPRDVVFVASSGHELGHLGINAFVDRRPGIVSRSAGWMHFGANIGAAQDPGNTVQASDDAFEKILADAMDAGRSGRDPQGAPRTVPAAKRRSSTAAAADYVSVIGRNALFYNPADRGPESIDPKVISSFETSLSGSRAIDRVAHAVT